MVFEVDVSRSAVRPGVLTVGVRRKGKLRLAAEIQGANLEFGLFDPDGSVARTGGAVVPGFPLFDVTAEAAQGGKIPVKQMPTCTRVGVVVAMAAAWLGLEAIGETDCGEQTAGAVA